jgi:hypothetical protein
MIGCYRSKTCFIVNGPTLRLGGVEDGQADDVCENIRRQLPLEFLGATFSATVRP